MSARTASVLFLLIAASASAQPVPPNPRPRPAERVALVAGGVLGGAGAAAGMFFALGKTGETRSGVVVVVAAYPVGVALATQVVGAAVGAEAPLAESFRDAIVGVPLGAAGGLLAGGAVGGLVYLIEVAAGSSEYFIVSALTGGAVGVLVGGAVSAGWASRRFRAAPAV